MTPADLISELAAEIEDAVKNFTFPAESQADKKISVWRQNFPREGFENATYYPYVEVKLFRVRDNVPKQNIEASVATVVITCGVYTEGKEGWRDLLNLCECIRQRLLTRRTIGKQFRLILPTQFEVELNQPEPFMIAYMTADYTVAQPQQQLYL